jgi:HEAT repeat protein
MKAIVPSFVLLAVAGVGYLEAGSSLIKKEDIPKAIQTLRSGSALARATAAEQLGHRGAVRSSDVKDAVEPLRYALKNDRDEKVRKEAARALGNIGRDLDETVPALMEAMKADKAMPVKVAAIQALGQIGPEARSAIAELRKIAGDKTNKQLIGPARLALKSINAR